MRIAYSKYTTQRSAKLRALSFACAALLVLSAATAVSSQTGPPTKTVLVLYDEHTSLPGLSMVDKSIRTALGSDATIKTAVFSESMDLSRLNRDGYEEVLSDSYKRKYAEQKIDAVIAVLEPSLDFALEHSPEFAPGAPVVFCGIDPQQIRGRELGDNVTGALVNRDFKGTLDLALRLHPNTREVFFVGGTSDFDKYLVDSAKEQLREFENRIKLTYLTDLPLNETLNRVSNLPSDSLVLYATMFKDGAGNSYVPHDVVTRISDSANAPLYGFVDQFVGRGLVGGHVYSLEAHGQKAAEIVLRILHGEKASSIPVVEVAVNIDMFDHRQLHRWGIDESSLPSGSTILFNDPTIWESYKWYIVGMTAAIIVEALLIAGLILLRVRRRQDRAENLRLSSRLGEIVSNVPGIVWETRTDPVTQQRKTTFISDYVQRLLGYTPEEWLKKPPGFGARLVHEADRERAQAESESVVETGKETISEFRWTTKDGRTRWVANYLSPLLDDDSNVVGLRGVALDITDRKSAEEVARQTLERNSGIVNAIPDLMFIQSADGVYLDYHASSPDDLLMPPEAFLGKSMHDVLPPELAVQFAETFRRASESGGPEVVEYSLQINGEERWYEARVVRTADNFVSVVRDITARKTAEKAIRESEIRLRRAQQAARVGTWDWEIATGASVWSEMIWELVGLEPSDNEITVTTFTEFIHPDDYERVLEKVNRALAEGDEYDDEFRLVRRDGTTIWVASKSAILRAEDGTPERMLGVNIDITERKEAERELQEAHDELNQLKNQLEAENIYLQEELRQDQAFGDIVGQSTAIKYVLYKISQVAPIDSTVLIMGETGTGKELVARAIHDASRRKDRPLIKVNCAALSPTLIESELFGHEKGAFTGAGARKLGRFELANTGTILLDEIGELPLDLQSKLLRVLQESEFERVGSAKTIKSDVRVIALTNRDLKLEVEKGKFREDLWYRLNVFPITTPPLRDRRDDIPILTEHFATTFARKFGKEVVAIAPDTLQALSSYGWPGNVRELANVVERAVINLRGSVLKIHEDFSVRQAEALSDSVKTLDEMERDYITNVLEDLHWRIDGPRGAAKVLGINPSTLRTRMVRLGIQKPNGKSPNGAS